MPLRSFAPAGLAALSLCVCLTSCALQPDFDERFASQIDIAREIGIEPSDAVVARVGTGGGPTPVLLEYVLVGDGVQDEVEGSLETAGFEASEPYRGWQHWQRDDGRMHAAVSVRPFSVGEELTIDGKSEQASGAGVYVSVR